MVIGTIMLCVFFFCKVTYLYIKKQQLIRSCLAVLFWMLQPPPPSPHCVTQFKSTQQSHISKGADCIKGSLTPSGIVGYPHI